MPLSEAWGASNRRHWAYVLTPAMHGVQDARRIACHLLRGGCDGSIHLCPGLVLNRSVRADELAEMDQSLRQFAATNGMSWVIEELDDAIATGVFERRDLRQFTHEGRTTYDDVPDVPGAGRRRAEEFVSRRALTPEEQIRMLVAGLRRVLSELDQVAAASVSQLNDLASVTQSPSDVDPTEESQNMPPRQVFPISEIDFVPDEGSAAVGVSTEGLRHSDRRYRTVEVLRRMEEAVDAHD